MAALASSGYAFFRFTNSDCSKDAFVHQDASVELHKSSYDPETGQHAMAQRLPCAVPS